MRNRPDLGELPDNESDNEPSTNPEVGEAIYWQRRCRGADNRETALRVKCAGYQDALLLIFQSKEVGGMPGIGPRQIAATALQIPTIG